jgi:hypothetical protein
VFCGCETWYISVSHIRGRLQHRLGLSENRVQISRVFVFVRDEVTGDWIKLLNEVLHNRFSSLKIMVIISRSVRWYM